MLINGVEHEITPWSNLGGADLRGADLHGANLRKADLHGADLRGASLHGASLRDANLSEADLGGANLGGANLYGAYLHGADLRDANLRDANLRDANLGGANLREANLREANLGEANLYGADLRGADLRGANLHGADLHGAKGIPLLVAAQLSIIPDGTIIGWKKLAGGEICKLSIPADALRSNATGRKCRASYAIVLEGAGVSRHDTTFFYSVGERVEPREPFNLSRWDECASGIHFFITREEAEAY